MISIHIDKQIGNLLPDMQLGCLFAHVKCFASSDDLDSEISAGIKETAKDVGQVQNISSHDVINASRKAYKILGKDPSRYRLSAEALRRRIMQGKGLYKINNVVDLLNLVSIRTGFSIGGYNCEKINGDMILGKGNIDEPYQAIGRGNLNIASLPVLRDDVGAFGSPTSDSQRTSIDENTTMVLFVFFNFDGNALMEDAVEMSKQFLLQYAKAQSIKQVTVKHLSSKR